LPLQKADQHLPRTFNGRETIAKGAELIVLPEVFSTGFCYNNIEETAEIYE